MSSRHYAAGALILLVIVPGAITSSSCAVDEIVPRCNDGARDGDETDVDCGGSCVEKCAESQACTKGDECTSGVCSDCTKDGCTGKVCSKPPCEDGVTNNSETDTDCGGQCTTKCANDRKCLANSDCSSIFCVNGLCVSSCNNLTKDDSETDVDCGGSCTAACGDGKTCGAASDCSSKSCVNNVCVSCHDVTMNGDETDVDCGGSCADRCANGKTCGAGADCSSTFCNKGVCVSQCDNATKDGDETDVDCGGSCAAKCSVGRDCDGNADCSSGACMGKNGNPSHCISDPMNSDCSDNVKDGLETDQDCGGGACPACVAGQLCNLDSDCAKKFKCVGDPGMAKCQ